MIPDAVLQRALAGPGQVVRVTAEPIGGSSGAATGGVTRLTGEALCGEQIRTFAIVAKRLRPLTSGRHAAASADPRHWAYWRREALAYASGLLPTGPGLAAPSCYGVVDDVVYLSDVESCPEDPHLAAVRLGEWQASTPVPAVPWLAGHQLAQRIAVGHLDWSVVDVDPRVPRIWSRREELLAALSPVPLVLSHGDFHIDQLSHAGERTIVLDWSTLGTAPAGADLAHLVLSTVDFSSSVFSSYVGAAVVRSDLIRIGYSVTAALTGVSRIHWMLSRGIPLPDGYVDFVLDQSLPSSC